jgi:hypothetical protein
MKPASFTPARKWRALLAALAIFGVAATLTSVAVPATAAGGSTLSAETFANGTVPDARWVGLGDSCLTASAKGSVAPAGSSNLGGCTKTQDSVTNLGSGSDGYLQLTDNSGTASAATVLNRAFPSAAGLTMTFDEYQYATTSTGIGAADGIGFFLADGSYTLTKAGPTGGSLGYASMGAAGGLDHGYLGVGLDVYGNYESQPYTGTSCPATSSRTPNSVTLRGSGNGLTGYCIVGTTTYSGLRNAPASAPGGAQGTLQRVTVSISPTTSADPYPVVTVSINGVQVLQETMTTPVPATVKLGFAASTGGGHEVHLIRNVTVSTINALGAIDLTKTIDHTATTKTIFTEGDTVPYSFLVTNTGEEALSDVHVTDPKIADISCPATTLQPADSFTCTGAYGPLSAADAAAGRFDNTATATGVDTDGATQTSTSTATVATYESAPLSVTKRVTGSGSAAVPQDAAFTVHYSYPAGDYEPASTASGGAANTYPAGSGTLTVANDGTATTAARIPTGAIVTLSEEAAAAVPGTTWGTPAFSQNPVTIGASAATAVTLTNPISGDTGTVAWSKTDSGTGDLLAGSEWSVTGPDGFTETVVDDASNDADDAAGKLTVEGLLWGDYTLTETKAPAGYALDRREHTFTIDAAHLAVTLDAITNTKAPAAVITPTPAPVPSAPAQPSAGAAVNTGGTSIGSPATEAMLWAGLIVVGGLGLAVTAVAVLRRKRRIDQN